MHYAFAIRMLPSNFRFSLLELKILSIIKRIFQQKMYSQCVDYFHKQFLLFLVFVHELNFQCFLNRNQILSIIFIDHPTRCWHMKMLRKMMENLAGRSLQLNFVVWISYIH